MKKLITTILCVVLLLGCKDATKHQTTEAPEFSEKALITDSNWNFKELLDKEIQYPLKKLKLNPITELNSTTLRIWIFPGGGSVFEQLLEYKEPNSELTFHSFLIQEYEGESNLSEATFSKIINEQKIKSELQSIISSTNFLDIKDSDQYCDPIVGCGDIYFVEFTNGAKTVKFIINLNIKDCDIKEAKTLKRIYKLTNEIRQKYS